MSGLNLSRNEIDILTDYIMTVLVSEDIDKDFLKAKRVSQAEIEKGENFILIRAVRPAIKSGLRVGLLVRR